MRRRLLNLVTLLSLLLCVAVVALWVRSYGRSESFWLLCRAGKDVHATSLATGRGDLRIYLAKGRENWRERRMSFERVACPPVGLHPPDGGYPVGRRCGPFSYAADPRPRAPSGEELAAARRAVAEWEKAKASPPVWQPQAAARMVALQRGAATAESLLDGGWDHWQWVVVFPGWAVMVPLLVLPATAAASCWQRRRRSARGNCRSCGYDLRATPDRCPECGATP